MELASLVDNLIGRQIEQWPLARDNYAALDRLAMRAIELPHGEVILQYNPERRRSSAARVDAASLAGRPCFLCPDNQPKDQDHIIWHGEGRQDYKIQVNPYPIFPRHLTIATLEHTPQAFFPPQRILHMLRLAEDLPDWVLFYNGPQSGASAPDHMHFQAAGKGYMPLPEQITAPALWTPINRIEATDDGFIGFTEQVDRPLFFIRAERAELAALYMARLQMAMRLARESDTAEEPLQNILCWNDDGFSNFIVFPRSKHRPDSYGEGKDQFLLSPAAADMAGFWCLCEEKDYKRLNDRLLQDFYDELCISHSTAMAIIDRFIMTHNNS